MSRLGDEIRRKMGARESKDLYADFEKALGSSENAGGLSTFRTKLSKLLNGDPEGERYFLEKPSRSSALEKALGVEAGWLDAQQQVRVLVLDPALPKEASAFFKEREPHAAGAYACREVSLDGLTPPVERTAVLARIREVAERESSPLVVASDDKDALYFTGAKIACTLVKPHPRGFLLASYPALVPLPEPPPPPLFDGKDEPLMPHAEFEILARRESAVRHSGDRHHYGSRQEVPYCQAPDCLFRGRDDYRTASDLDAISQALWQAKDADRPASFPVSLVLAWQLSRQDLRLIVVRDAGQEAYASALWVTRSGIDGKLAERVHQALWGSGSTILWSHARQILGVGPLIEQVTRLLAPHHPIAQPSALLRWKDALESWNPWRTGGDSGLAESERWKALRGDVLGELGLPIDGTVGAWRMQVARRCARPQTPARLATPEEEQRAHEALATLAARSWGLESWHRAWPLRLDAASRARLAILPGHGAHEGLHVVANLGAGRLLRIQVVRFPGEDPTEIVKCVGDFEMDGGDVHVWFEELSDQALEGSALPARERRRREAAD